MKASHVATLVVGALALVLLGVGAVAAQAKVDGNAQTTEVTLAGWASSPEETSALNRTIASFERLNRDIKVE